MAFRSFTGASRPAGTVRLVADTGSFNADIDRAEAKWRDSVGSMSREALKLDLAQNRLKSSLAKYGAESNQAKRATIGLRDAEEQARRAADRTTREFDQQQRSLGRLSRGALAGSGAFRGLGRSLAFASSGFLGGAGLVYGIRQALNASSNLAEQTDFARRTFKSAGDEVIRFSNNALGLARDQALDAAAGIGSLIAPLLKNDQLTANLSVRLSKLGVDFASIKNARVEDTLEAIRAGLVGETEPLRRYAVLLSAAKVNQEALRQTGKESTKQLTEGEKVLARVAIILREGSYAAGNYADTIKGAANQEREAQKNWRNTQILLGDTLRPTYQGLLQDINAYIGNARNQEEIQRKVNEAVKTGIEVVKGLVGGLRAVKTVAEPVVNALGGVENAVKTIGLLWVGFKVKALAGFAGTALASRTTSARMIVDATAAGRAWDIATRPRNMVVTTTGGGAAGGTTTGPAGRRGLPGTTGTRGTGLVGFAAVVAGVFGVQALTQTPSLAAQQRKIADMSRVDPERALEMARAFAQQFDTPIASLTTNNPLLKKYGKPLPSGMTLEGFLGVIRGVTSSFGQPVPSERGAGDVTGVSTGRTGGRSRSTGTGLSRFQRLTLAASQAELTADLRDDLRAARDLEQHYARIASNEKLKGDKLFKARQDLLSAQQRTQAIEDQIAADRQAGQEKAAAKRKAAREKAQQKAERQWAAEKRAFDQWNKSRAASLIGGGLGERQNEVGRRGSFRPIGTTSTKDPDAVTREELGTFLRDFAEGFMDIQRNLFSQFLGGTGTGNSLQTHALEQWTLQGNQQRGETNALLRRIAGARQQRLADEGLMA